MIENPEATVFNSFVTTSIWNQHGVGSSVKFLWGVGASQRKPALTAYYKQTNQQAVLG
jgi:hypothetical protein